jgi:hypothetical protein
MHTPVCAAALHVLHHLAGAHMVLRRKLVHADCHLSKHHDAPAWNPEYAAARSACSVLLPLEDVYVWCMPCVLRGKWLIKQGQCWLQLG